MLSKFITDNSFRAALDDRAYCITIVDSRHRVTVININEMNIFNQ